MAYRVIKKINGSHYLYEQETYREGGKVRTRSQYIGAVDPKQAARLKSHGEPLDAALIPAPSQADAPANDTGPVAPPPSATQTPETELNTTKQQLSTKTKAAAPKPLRVNQH